MWWRVIVVWLTDDMFHSLVRFAILVLSTKLCAYTFGGSYRIPSEITVWTSERILFNPVFNWLFLFWIWVIKKGKKICIAFNHMIVLADQLILLFILKPLSLQFHILLILVKFIVLFQIIFYCFCWTKKKNKKSVNRLQCHGWNGGRLNDVEYI